MKPEQILHKQVASYLSVALRSPTFFTTFPAGGGGKVRGALLKSMGLKSGFPDILVIHPQPVGVGMGCDVLGVELKTSKGRLSTDQVDTHEALTVAGARVAVCRSVEDVQAFLGRHGVPLHAHVFGDGFQIAGDNWQSDGQVAARIASKIKVVA